jgi:hypothetical protein
MLPPAVVSPVQYRPMHLRAAVAAAVVTAGALACRSATAPAPGARVDLASVVPAGPPYITGTVVARGSRLGDGRPSVHVATDPRDPVADPIDRAGNRNPNRSAHVVLDPDVTVVHRDGRRATADGLQPGRVVTAWVGPTELQSLPPVVFGRVMVIEP